MAQTPEGKVKARLKNFFKEQDIYYAMPVGTGYGNSGVPDFLCCMNGRFVAVETKANGGLATALQIKHLREIESCGGVSWVVQEDNIDLFEIWVKSGGEV
jgi:pantoate kinase